MFIVDAQIHLWESRTGPAHHRTEPLGADELIASMDEAGISRVVNCPAIWDVNANQIANDAARRYPGRVATMGWIPLSPAGNSEQFAQWKEQPGMLGLRFVIVDPQQREWLETGKLDWIWHGAERYRIPIGFTAPGALPCIYRLAQRFAGTRFVIDHMGAGALGKVPDAFDHLPDLLRMADLPNVGVKATAAPAYATDNYPFRSVHPYLRSIFDAFGPTRMFWGTDVTRLSCTWRECVTMFTEHLPWLSGDDLDLVMGRAICKWIGWDR